MTRAGSIALLDLAQMARRDGRVPQKKFFGARRWPQFPSKQKIPLRHRQHVGRLADQQLAVGASPRRSPDRPSIFGVASLWIMLFLPILPRVFSTATRRFCDARACAPGPPPPRAFETNSQRRCRCARGRRRRTSAGNAPAAASGSRRWGRPSAPRRSTPPLMTQVGLHAEERRRPQHEVGELALLDRADVLRHAVGDGGIDGVFGDVALDADIVVVAACRRGRRPRWRLHLVGGLPGADDDFADAGPSPGCPTTSSRARRGRAGCPRRRWSPCGCGSRRRRGPRRCAGSRWWQTISMSRCSSSVLRGVGPRRIGRRRQHVRRGRRP